MYSTFIVDNATYFCNLDYHETAPSKKVIKNPNIDFIESTSPTISISVYPFNITLSVSKHKHTLKVPLRYLIIHFTTAQCSFLGSIREKLTRIPAAYAISSLVHIMKNIKLPTIDA